MTHCADCNSPTSQPRDVIRMERPHGEITQLCPPCDAATRLPDPPYLRPSPLPPWPRRERVAINTHLPRGYARIVRALTDDQRRPRLLNLGQSRQRKRHKELAASGWLHPGSAPTVIG